MLWDQELEDEEKGKKEEIDLFFLSLGWKKLKCFQGQTQHNSSVNLAYESFFEPAFFMFELNRFAKLLIVRKTFECNNWNEVT